MSIWTTVEISLNIRSDKHFSLRKHIEQHLNRWDVVFYGPHDHAPEMVQVGFSKTYATFRFDCGGLKAARYIEDIYKGIPIDHSRGSGEWIQLEATVGWE